MKKRILFLDRDGTIIKEPPEDYQVDSFEKLAFLPGVIHNLRRLQEQDYVWVMITNQDGLGTEAFPEETFWPPHDLMLEILKGEGISFDEIVIDRTFKHEGAPTRKPETGLLTHYMDGSYDLANSIVVGDRPSDIKLAENLGAKGILLGRSTDTQDDDHDLVAMGDTLLLQTDNWDEITDLLLKPAGRVGKVHRKTAETDIRVEVDLDGTGKSDTRTGIGFFDHMLDQLAKHSRSDISVHVKGDLHIDPHHSIEDAGLALGTAFRQALGDKRGIARYGCFNLVMDEALAEVALDFSG
ncbi:MAG: histidinol-phosphatase, partial [Bacteroidota bacterium]